MKQHTIIRLASIILLVLGFGLRYWINRRKFYRRAITGLERFRSNERSVLITLFEKIGLFIAKLLIAAGIFIGILSFIKTDI